jgi:hypothetical protein
MHDNHQIIATGMLLSDHFDIQSEYINFQDKIPCGLIGNQGYVIPEFFWKSLKNLELIIGDFKIIIHTVLETVQATTPINVHVLSNLTSIDISKWPYIRMSCYNINF